MDRNPQKISRKQVDITKLPKWQQYPIVVIVIGSVIYFALKFGNPEAAPEWVNQYLIPTVIILGLIIWVVVFVKWLGNKIK